MTRTFGWIPLLGALLLGAAPDEGIYEPAPPPNAGFLRVVHADATSGVLTARVSGITLPSVSYGEVTPYAATPSGQVVLDLGVRKETLSIATGNFYTAVVTPRTAAAAVPAASTGGGMSSSAQRVGEQLVLFVDPHESNLAKSLVTIYNLAAEGSAELRYGGQAVCGASPLGVSGRSVNSTRASLTLHLGEEEVAQFDDVFLDRGQAYGVFLFGPDKASWVQAGTVTR